MQGRLYHYVNKKNNVAGLRIFWATEQRKKMQNFQTWHLLNILRQFQGLLSCCKNFKLGIFQLS